MVFVAYLLIRSDFMRWNRSGWGSTSWCGKTNNLGFDNVQWRRNSSTILDLRGRQCDLMLMGKIEDAMKENDEVVARSPIVVWDAIIFDRSIMEESHDNQIEVDLWRDIAMIARQNKDHIVDLGIFGLWGRPSTCEGDRRGRTTKNRYE